MTSYLLDADPLPFAPEEIRLELGLKSTTLDPVIAAGIASACSLSRRMVRREVWGIACEGGDIYRYGTPENVSEPTQLPGSDKRMFWKVTYPADPEAVARAKRVIVNWCRDQDDIHAQLMAEANSPNVITMSGRLTKRAMDRLLEGAVADALGVPATSLDRKSQP